LPIKEISDPFAGVEAGQPQVETLAELVRLGIAQIEEVFDPLDPITVADTPRNPKRVLCQSLSKIRL